MNGLRALPGLLLAASVTLCLFSSCTMTTDQQFVREKIPVDIQRGTPITIKISSLSGNGWNDVGIRCSADTWETLARDSRDITVQLMSSNKDGTRIINVSPGGGKLWPVDSYYYLFAIGGQYGASASVQITFPSAPEGTTHAEVLVLNTPADTGP